MRVNVWRVTGKTTYHYTSGMGAQQNVTPFAGRLVLTLGDSIGDLSNSPLGASVGTSVEITEAVWLGTAELPEPE